MVERLYSIVGLSWLGWMTVGTMAAGASIVPWGAWLIILVVLSLGTLVLRLMQPREAGEATPVGRAAPARPAQEGEGATARPALTMLIIIGAAAVSIVMFAVSPGVAFLCFVIAIFWAIRRLWRYGRITVPPNEAWILFFWSRPTEKILRTGEHFLFLPHRYLLSLPHPGRMNIAPVKRTVVPDGLWTKGEGIDAEEARLIGASPSPQLTETTARALHGSVQLLATVAIWAQITSPHRVLDNGGPEKVLGLPDEEDPGKPDETRPDRRQLESGFLRPFLASVMREMAIELTLEEVMRARNALRESLREALNLGSEEHWGVRITTVEFQEFNVGPDLRAALEAFKREILERRSEAAQMVTICNLVDTIIERLARVDLSKISRKKWDETNKTFVRNPDFDPSELEAYRTAAKAILPLVIKQRIGETSAAKGGATMVFSIDTVLEQLLKSKEVVK